MKLLSIAPSSGSSSIRSGAEGDTESRKRDLQLNAQEASLSQAEVNVEANKAPLEDAQQQLEKNQADLDKAEAQLSRAQADIDDRQSQVSEAKVDDSVNPTFSGSQNKDSTRMKANQSMQYVYNPKTVSMDSLNANDTGVYPGVNPDVMNQINRVEPTDPAATQADKQPEPPKNTVEITSPTQAALSKDMPKDDETVQPKNQPFTTLDIQKAN
jgi:hypothetical protein